MKNFGRNFIIAFLMVLTIYQTGELWFGNFSDHNFFSLFNNSETTYSKNVAYTLNRLIVNVGVVIYMAVSTKHCLTKVCQQLF